MKIEARFRKTVDDYIESQSSYVRKNFWYRLYVVMSAGTALFAIYKVIFIDIFQGFLLGLLAAFWLLPSLLFSLRFRRSFRKQATLSSEYRMTADNDGLEMIGELNHGGGKWAAFTGFRETPNLFLIFTGERTFISVPKRAFSPPRLNQFRELLVQNSPASSLSCFIGAG